MYLAQVRMEDRELIDRFLAGERDCFTTLVQRHARALWGSVRRTATDLEEARDVFQETWLRAFEGLGALRERERVRSWLLSIALNLIRQGHRRNALRARVPLEESELEGREPEVGGALEHREEVGRLRRLMQALPRRQGAVLDLRLNHEMTHGEIGKVLGISPENSRANYYQALRKLRSQYEGAVPPDEECGAGDGKR